MFPPEIVDHILSFLQWDRAALSVCAKAHPSISKLVERHFYVHLSVGDSPAYYYSPSDLLERTINNPNIAKYVRSLQISLSVTPWNSNFYWDMGLILHKVTQLQAIDLSSPHATFTWYHLCESFRTAFISCLKLPTLTDVQLSGINAFPLSVLNHSSSLKRLSLLRSSCDPHSVSPFVYSRLDSLVLHDCSSTAVEKIITWAESSDLRSLEFLGDLRSFTRLLEVYANTLTDVKVLVPHDSKMQGIKDLHGGKKSWSYWIHYYPEAGKRIWR